MADDRTITIGINVDPEGAVTGIEEVEGATVQLADEGGDAGMDFGQAMEVALGNLAADAAAELGSQLRDLVNNGMELLSGSLDDANVQRLLDDKLKLALDNAGGAAAGKTQKLKGLASELQKTTDFSNEQIQAAQSLFITYGASAEGAARLSESVADLATFASAGSERTVSLNRAARTLGRTMDGSTQSLQRLGVSLDEATKQEIKAADGMERIEIVAEAMEEKVGGAAERLSTPWTGLQNDIDDLQKTFGQELIPIAIETSEKLRQVAQDEDVKEGIREVAQEVADLLAQGIEMTGRIVGLFAEYREEIGAAADVTFRLVTAVGAYVAGAKAYTLWTNRAVIAQKAATVAQRGLNAAMKANPVGLVVSALTVVLPLLYQFRDRITDAAASVLDFSAKTIRGLQGVVQWFQDLLRGIPDALAQSVPGLQQFRALVEGAGAAVEASADQMEGWADSLRETGEETEEHTVQMGENQNQVDLNTEAVEGNTEAVNENAQAREEAANAPPAVPSPEVEEPKNQVIEPDVSFDMESLISDAESAEQALRAGLIQSINEADTAIRELQDAYDSATTKPARQEIQAMIDKLKRHRDEMEVAKKAFVDFGPAVEKAAEQALTNFGEGIGEMMAGVSTAADVGKSVLKTLASLAERVGKIAIGAGVAVEGIKRALQSLNPVAAIAAGVSLIALAAAVRSKLQSAAEGGGGEIDQPRGSDETKPRTANVPSFQEGVENFEGGLARVHEEELLVNLAPGTSVLPSMTMPRSPTITTAGVQRAASGGGASAADIEGLEGKLDEVAQRFEKKQFRLRGTDQVTQQERTRAELDDAGIK